MSLQRITIADRQNLIQALELPIYELEDGSHLTDLLHELECREDHYGIDIYTGIREDVELVLQIDEDIRNARVEEADENISGFSVSVPGQFSYSRSTGGIGSVNGEQAILGSPVASRLEAKRKLVMDIKRNLDAYQRSPDSHTYGLPGFYGRTNERSSGTLNLG